jgi:hypothetical protein
MGEEAIRLGVEALDAEVADLHAADPLQAPIFTRNLPEGCRHLNSSESPPYRCKRWPRERSH